MDLLLEDDRIRERQREENRARKRNIKRLLKVQDKKGKLGGHDRTGTRVTDDTPLKAPPNLSTSTAATSATAATSSSRTSVRLPQSSDSNSGRLVKSPTEETVLGSTTSSMDLPSRPAQALPKIDSGRAKRVKTSNILKNTSQILGSGAHGTVYLGLNTVNGELVAIKEISFQKMGQNSEEVRQQINNIVREIALMKALDHPNIVPYYGAERNKQTLQIVMEYIPGGSLKSIIQHFGHLHERVVRRYGGQMLCGLEYLHGQGVAHLDIKNDNALLAVTGEVKLADFGGSEKFAGGNLSTKTVGTPLFMAPEVIKGTGHSVSADIWSLGITFIELLAGEAPMYGIRDGFAVMFKVASLTEPPRAPSHVGKECAEFVESCLQLQASARPTASELLMAPFITHLASDDESPAGSPAVGPSSIINSKPLETNHAQQKVPAQLSPPSHASCLQEEAGASDEEAHDRTREKEEPPFSAPDTNYREAEPAGTSGRARTNGIDHEHSELVEEAPPHLPAASHKKRASLDVPKSAPMRRSSAPEAGGKEPGPLAHGLCSSTVSALRFPDTSKRNAYPSQQPAEPMWGVGDAKTMIKVNSKTESELNGTFANTSSRAKLARAARKAFNVSKVMYPNGFADLDVLQSFVSFSSSFAVSNDENDTSYLRTLKAQQQQGLITAFELKTKKTALFGLSSSDSLVRCGTSAAV